MCKYCEPIVRKINDKYPNNDWNCDQSCKEWLKESENIPHNDNPEFIPEDCACNCPYCGTCICGWCQ